MNNKKVSAFTLSEVLITLVIIGVIAAITLPVLYANYQEQSIKSALKKNYSALKQALDRYQADNGERLYAGQTEGLDNDELKNHLIKYMNVIYDCGNGTETSDSNYACYSNPKFNSNTSVNYKNYKGTSNIDGAYFDDGQFVLNDGSLILIENVSSSRVYVSVDVNGFGKKPNRLGRDLFMFQLTTKGELLPMGAKGTDYYSINNKNCSNTSSSNMNGAGCTAKVLQD